MLEDMTGTAEGPMWSNSLGMIIGCLIGIVVPKAILSNSATMGINKISAR